MAFEDLFHSQVNPVKIFTIFIWEHSPSSNHKPQVMEPQSVSTGSIWPFKSPWVLYIYPLVYPRYLQANSSGTMQVWYWPWDFHSCLWGSSTWFTESTCDPGRLSRTDKIGHPPKFPFDFSALRAGSGFQVINKS